MEGTLEGVSHLLELCVRHSVIAGLSDGVLVLLEDGFGFGERKIIERPHFKLHRLRPPRGEAWSACHGVYIGMGMLLYL